MHHTGFCHLIGFPWFPPPVFPPPIRPSELFPSASLPSIPSFKGLPFQVPRSQYPRGRNLTISCTSQFNIFTILLTALRAVRGTRKKVLVGPYQPQVKYMQYTVYFGCVHAFLLACFSFYQCESTLHDELIPSRATRPCYLT